MRKRWFEWNEISSVPEDLDELEEDDFENSLTFQSASYRKRLQSTSSDDSGIGIEDTDSKERDSQADNDSEDEADSCKERVTGRHILHSQELEDSLQEAAVCAYCLDGKLELWHDSRRRERVQSALFWRSSSKNLIKPYMHFREILEKTPILLIYYLHQSIRVLFENTSKTFEEGLSNPTGTKGFKS